MTAWTPVETETLKTMYVSPEVSPRDLDRVFWAHGWRAKAKDLKLRRPRVRPNERVVHPVVRALADRINSEGVASSAVLEEAGLNRDLARKWFRDGRWPQMRTFIRVLNEVGLDLKVVEIDA